MRSILPKDYCTPQRLLRTHTSCQVSLSLTEAVKLASHMQNWNGWGAWLVINVLYTSAFDIITCRLWNFLPAHDIHLTNLKQLG